MAGGIFKDEEEAAKAMEDLFTAVVNGDTAAAEALEDMHRRTVGHRPLDDNVMSRFAEFKKEQRERWKYKFVYDDPKFPGTNEGVIGSRKTTFRTTSRQCTRASAPCRPA